MGRRCEGLAKTHIKPGISSCHHSQLSMHISKQLEAPDSSYDWVHRHNPCSTEVDNQSGKPFLFLIFSLTLRGIYPANLYLWSALWTKNSRVATTTLSGTEKSLSKKMALHQMVYWRSLNLRPEREGFFSFSEFFYNVRFIQTAWCSS